MCGIFGIYSLNASSIINEVIYRLSLLQHRGKDGCGIGYISESESKGKIECIKKPGLVKEAFNNYMNYDHTYCCIGHLKYATSGKSVCNSQNLQTLNKSEMQPLIGRNLFSNDAILLVHNGNIPTIKQFDTQFIFNTLIKSNQSIESTLINIINKIPAAYCFLIIVNDTMYVMRDRYGIRPLSMGVLNNYNCYKNICISSETRALEHCINIKEITPGTIMRINKTGTQTIYQHPNSVNGICALELLYFMNPKSYITNISVEFIRNQLGKLIAQKENIIKPNSDYIVVGVPKSGIIYAKSYANALSLSYKQLIEKTENCENGEDRTFILINDIERQKACRKKFKYDAKKIKGKKVVIVDDTIIRGTIITYIVECFKKCGAEEIHIRIPAPPVIDRCQLGIAIQSKEELIMNNKTVMEIQEYLGINSLKYLSVNDLTMFPKHSYKEYFGCGIAPEIVNSIEQIEISF